jgi:hypothetical protein
MQRWLYQCEVEAHLVLPEGAPPLTIEHPTGRYKIILRNKELTPGMEAPLLDAFVVFEAADLGAAESAGDEYLREFISTLAFATGSHMKVRREVLLCDWTAGNAMHDCWFYNSFPPGDFPVPALDQQLMESARALLERERDPVIERALRWFRNGVSLSPPDEQFVSFWRCIEVLARHDRDVTPVPDACPHCHGPLYCPSCGKTPTHRPYDKQAIQLLMRRHGSAEADKLFAACEVFRNALAHGDSLRSVEEKCGREIKDVVDDLGRTAQRALCFHIVPAGRGIPVVRPRTFLHRRLRATAVGAFGSPAEREPALADLPGIKLSIIRK